MNQQYKLDFLRAAENWICNSYTIVIRYFALEDAEGIFLVQAAIHLFPLHIVPDLICQLHVSELFAGQVLLERQTREQALEILRTAADGRIDIHGRMYSLRQDQALNYYSEMSHRGRWFCDLHLNVTGSNRPIAKAINFATIDDGLRSADVPFDGLQDLVYCLSLKSPDLLHLPPAIDIRINPPADFFLEKSKLDQGVLTLILHAHREFELDRILISIRTTPGNGAQNRSQIAPLIRWTQSTSDYSTGTLKRKWRQRIVFLRC